MAAADFRAVLAALTVVVVGLFGEIGSPVVYLCGGLFLAVIFAAIASDRRFEIRSDDLLWWVVTFWGVMAALAVSGGALASKTTLASWVGAWIVWAAVVHAGAGRRKTVSIFLVSGAVVLGGAVVAGIGGAPRLITNHNISAALIVSAVPLALELFRSPWRARSVVALLLIPVVLTGSRAGVLAVLVIAISLWPAGRSRSWAVVLGGIGACSAIAWRVISRPESLAWYRWRIWGAIVESIGDRPLWGIGAGNVADAMGPYRLEHAAEVGRWGHVIGGAESTLLGLALRVGLPGAVLAVAALVVWFLRSRRPTPSAAAALGAMIMMGLFHDFWSEPAVLWWWAAAFGLVTLRRPESAGRQHGGAGFPRWPVAMAIGGLTAWALVQPAWAQWLWRHSEPSAEAVVTAVRAEPWFSEPMRWRVQNLLVERRWTWAQASEALEWSRRNLEIQPGSAGAWNLRARVNARIVEEFGAWPMTVENARSAFGRASALEPRLPWHPYSHALMERGLGNLERALKLASHSVELEPAFVRGRLLVSRLELDGGHLEAARRTFESGLSTRNACESRAWTAYHRDLIQCPVWQVQALEQELQMSNNE